MPATRPGFERPERRGRILCNLSDFFFLKDLFLSSQFVFEAAMLSIPVILLVEEFLQGMKGGLLFRSVGGLKGGSKAC